ncbi:MAG: pyrroloquinoline quinone biosynthesis protein PqqE [bacterium ADurb.Bin132]|nr:MAG: pyrroloquinoline quinone biosynthesis protein PqqE [bacterium ADurb.Bin132]
MYKKLSAPIGIQWELTSWCNHHCIYCYNYWRANTSILPDFLKSKEQNIIANEIINNKIFDICLTGGEPLFVIDKYYDCLLKLKNANIKMTLNSNLSSITNEHVNILKDIGINSILVSFPSDIKEVHDVITGVKNSYDKVVSGIKYAINNNFNISISMVVTKINLNTIKSTANFIKDLGCNTFCVTRASYPSWNRNFLDYNLSHIDVLKMLDDTIWTHDNLNLEIDTLTPCPICGFTSDKQREHFHYRGCGAGCSSAIIGSSGQLRPCPQSEYNYGSVLDVGLKAAWDLMDDYRNDVFVPKYCKEECDAFPYDCQGGCRTYSKNMYGSLDSEDPMCTRKILTKKPSAKKTNLILDDNYIIGDNEYRKEEFGYIVFSSRKNWVPIDDELFNILSNNSVINKQMIENELSVKSDEANYILYRLINNNIVLPISNKKGGSL